MFGNFNEFFRLQRELIGPQCRRRVVYRLHFRGSRGEGNQFLEERLQFAVLGAVRQSGQELFSQHFPRNRTPLIKRDVARNVLY